MTLDDILDLVGVLDDTPGEDTGRERFRKYLSKSVTEVGLLRDYTETCLRTSGAQYNRALQDLVNHAGRLMGFDVQFGRFRGECLSLRSGSALIAEGRGLLGGLLDWLGLLIGR